MSGLSEFKHHLKSLKHKSKSSRLAVDKKIHAEKSKEYDVLSGKTKHLYYTNVVLDCAGNQRALFSIINHLLHHTSSMSLPEAESNLAITNDFAVFFNAKIAKIHAHLNAPTRPCYIQPEALQCNVLFNSFAKVTDDDVDKIMRAAQVNSCPLDC